MTPETVTAETMTPETMTARNALIETLDQHVGEMTFTYGQPIADGDARCRLIMTLEKDLQGRPYYAATICTPRLPGSEAESIPWEVRDDRGDTIACGRTGRRGTFRFPADPVLLDQPITCTLHMARRIWPVELPPRDSVWRRAARETAYVAKAGVRTAAARDSDRGALRLVLDRLWLCVPADDIPYGLVSVAAIRDGQIVRTSLLPMPTTNDDPPQRENWLDVRDLVGTAPPEAFEFDAWPVTQDPATRRQVTREDLEQLLARREIEQNEELKGKLQGLLAVVDSCGGA